MLALLAFLAPSYFAFSCGTELPVVALRIGAAELRVEVASTPTTRACGLSQRDRLDPERGMLFVFPEAAPRKFWMNDTRIPLSIAFLDAERRVLNVLAMTPLETEPRYPSAGAARYALEVNEGWFEQHAIGVGDLAEFTLPRVLLVE
jgi:uncharacterized membrane protein (UPF0127 family)